MTEELYGYIYCLSNPSFHNPDGFPLYKIGKTKNNPYDRAKKLYTTSVVYPFKIEFAKKVKNYGRKEKLIHSLLEQYGCKCNPSREFFNVNKNIIFTIFELIDGEYYKEDIEEVEEEEIEDEDTDTFMSVKCRDPNKCFMDRQELRHTIGITDTWYFKYNKTKNCFIYDNNDYKTMNKITELHYKTSRPDRCYQNNAWKECEVKKNSSWISIYDLKKL